MQRVAAAAATFLLTGTCLADQPSLRFDDGAWFDGERFVAATVFVANGRLRFVQNKDGRVLELGPPPPAPPED